MQDEFVIDASVAAKCFLSEEGSDAARRRVIADHRFLAPDLLVLEIANVAARHARRGTITEAFAVEMVRDVGGLVDEIVPTSGLVESALEFALQGFSAYDGVYLALAMKQGCAVLTADAKLLERARERGLAGLVAALQP